MTRRLRVLLLEPYLGGSHAAFAHGWRDRSRHEIVVMGHPAQHWRWRMRGAAVSLARDVRARWSGAPPDVVVASNMIDLAGFIGLSGLGSVPRAVYLHENQFSYPRQPGEPLDTGLAWLQWTGLVAADQVWCNSAFHRDELVAGLDALLATVPDEGHEPERAALDAKLRVFPPGVDVAACRAVRGGPGSGPPLIVSNQRWHHDKDVAAVVRAVRRLVDDGTEVELAVVGDSAGGEATTIDPLLDTLGHRVVARGHLPWSDYVALLGRADIVASAARGENFGIAVVEAMAAGAWPVVPAALAYPEVIPAIVHPDCLYEPGGLGRLLRRTVARVAVGERPPSEVDRAMDRYDWSVAAPRLDHGVDALRAESAAGRV